MIRIATWNVNSVRARLPNVIDWLTAASPDVVLLQEIKCLVEAFPRTELEALGYHLTLVGQKSYNGVAILSRQPVTNVLDRLPGAPEDEQARYVEANVQGLRVASIYLPNGNPVAEDSEKYPYKLRWMARLREHAQHLLDTEQPVVLGGDYNVMPTALDVYDPKGWERDALYRLETRLAFRAIMNQGWTDAFRTLHPDKRAYTFWDYKSGGWDRGQGLRIDHFLLSPQAADRLVSCTIDNEPRGREKASDHTPVIVELRA